MDGRPHGIQMTPTGGGPKYLRTLCWQGTHQCSAFFCALRNLLICSLVGSFFQEEGVCGGCKNKGPGAREPKSFLCPR